ncbi:MAG: hypothetical protein COW30_09945 [Rhodospirillales bacterium CG15_BIG_FIL_POST_REV_8_21_14_020_66_15]|nr:MAG: hypothetical protein COW30_09945 [Rhodospirillales bacterium CG15_BIG_FIL_POST_REV_8_21_14_020_66_15]
MGRPAKFDRDIALESVMNEFWRNGYKACSVKAISEHLGITRSSFYNTFKSREDLFRECLGLYAGRAPDRFLSDVTPETPVLPLLASVFHGVCRARAADPEARGCLVVNSMAELIGVDADLGPILEGMARRGRDRFRALLRQAVKNGEIADADDMDETALALQSLLIGINVMSKVERSEKRLWGMARRTLEGWNLYAA